MAAKSKPVEVLSVADLGSAGRSARAGARQEITAWSPPNRARPARSTSTRVTARRRSSRTSSRSKSSRSRHVTVLHLGRRRARQRITHRRTSLELLTHARALAPSCRAVTWGDGAALAAQAGEYGATTLYDVGRPRRRPARRAGRRGDRSARRGQGAPDAILIPTSYDGRDIAGRLSARLDRPVLTNVTGLRDEGGLVTEHPVFGGTQTVKARFTGAGPGSSSCARSPSSPKPAGGAPANVVAAPPGDTGASGTAKITREPRRGAHGTQARRGGGRRLGWAWSGRGGASTR